MGAFPFTTLRRHSTKTSLRLTPNRQSISQVSQFRLCYSICCLIWAIVGYGMGQIRTLARFTWIANWAVFINLMIM